MLFDEDILVALEKAADKSERTRSSFWETELEDFSFTAKGEMTGLICVSSISKKYTRSIKLLTGYCSGPTDISLEKAKTLVSVTI